MRTPPQFVRIFLVEDAAPYRRQIAEMLSEEGGGLLILSGTFDRLDEAAAMLGEEIKVDLLLLGTNEGDLNALSTFAAAHPDLPVIVLSDEEDAERGAERIRQGAQDVLPKSDLTGRGLVRAICFALERKRAEAVLRAGREEAEQCMAGRERELAETHEKLSRVLDELSAVQAQRIQQERLDAMERMASGIAHDFNNALSPILAHSEWLLRKPGELADEEKLKKALCKIHESAEYCAEIVMRLRGFSQPDNTAGAMEPLDLSEVLMEAIRTTQTHWKDHARARGCEVEIQTRFDRVPKVEGHRNELRQMFTDLILNAVDAIPGKGVMTAAIGERCGKVLASIADDGIGMSSEVLSRCLEPFFTTKSHAGVGLGLGVVHGIAHRHKAAIEIESREGQGTKVTVEFPIAEGEKEAPTDQTLTGLRVFAVEDEPNIREILAVYLAEDGHKVELASNGAEALERFVPGHFDLLLTDYSMPKMNGDLLAAEIRARDPQIRIALLTGFGVSLPQGASLRLEIDSIISKPFTFETLRQGIAEAMKGR